MQKAPAIAQALKEISNSQSEIKITGTEHGEKLYDSLVFREEMTKSEDMGAIIVFQQTTET